MRWQDALSIMKQTAPSATQDDAMSFIAICEERGLSPFVEASPLIQDYYSRSNKKQVHSLAVKESYTVQERWAQQCGGYTVRRVEIEPAEDGGLKARVYIISNRDYAAVGKLAAMGIPGFDWKTELAAFEVCGESSITGQEASRRPPATKDWQWVVTKRAREAALREKFGKEPSQSRQLYAAALTHAQIVDGANALYGMRRAPR